MVNRFTGVVDRAGAGLAPTRFFTSGLATPRFVTRVEVVVFLTVRPVRFFVAAVPRLTGARPAAGLAARFVIFVLVTFLTTDFVALVVTGFLRATFFTAKAFLVGAFFAADLFLGVAVFIPAFFATFFVAFLAAIMSPNIQKNLDLSSAPLPFYVH